MKNQRIENGVKRPRLTAAFMRKFQPVLHGKIVNTAARLQVKHAFRAISPVSGFLRTAFHQHSN